MISDSSTSFGISFILPFGSRYMDEIVVGIWLSGAFSDICMYRPFISFFKTIIEENYRVLDAIKDGKLSLINPKITKQKDKGNI